MVGISGHSENRKGGSPMRRKGYVRKGQRVRLGRMEAANSG